MSDMISTTDYMALTYEEKIMIMADHPERLALPDEASYLAQFLADYRPIVPPEAHPDNETSVDIADTLQSICIIDTKLVSRVMKMLGYKLHFQGISQPTWAMKHIESI